jgi:hypothetical protein
MITTPRERIARSIAAAGIIAFVGAMTASVARAGDQTYIMKISTPTINDVPDTFGKYFAAADENTRKRGC